MSSTKKLPRVNSKFKKKKKKRSYFLVKHVMKIENAV